MKIQINKDNSKNFVFHIFDQRKHKKYHYCCSVFAPFVNVTVNCRKTHNIDLNRNDLDIVIDRMVKDWKLLIKKNSKWFAWGKWEDWFFYTLNYIKEQVKLWRKNEDWKEWIVPNYAEFKRQTDDKNLMTFINNWYAILVWMWVNEQFVRDMIDWKIEKYEDYKNYKWDKLKHFTNIWKWLRTWPWWQRYWEEFMLDNYAHNQYWFKWMYWNFNIKEWLEDILYPTKYVFF